MQPCQAFPKLKTKDFAERFLVACKVSLENIEVYIKNLAVLVREHLYHVVISITFA